MKKLSLGFSPCPNDTFIFDALVHHKIDTHGLEFDIVLEDVQTLNQWAKAGKLVLSKVSYGVLPAIKNQYRILNSGGALGKGVGPLLISNSQQNVGKDVESMQSAINRQIIAIPGQDTTAHFLFAKAFPNAQHKVFMPFHEIENYVLSHPGSMGVIIHENRFTYQQKGLFKLADLGNFWEHSTGLPIPLGGIVARRDIDIAIARKVDELIAQSVTYALNNYPKISDYVACHAQEMSEDVMQQHIDLYVNDFSVSMGNAGKHAVLALLASFGIPETEHENLFLD